MAYIIIGATGSLGRALAELLAAKGHDLVLVARNVAALETLAEGIARDGHGRPAIVAADIADGANYLSRVREAARSRGGIEGLIFPIGRSIRDDLNTPAEEIAGLIAVNLTGVVDAVTEFWADLRGAPRPVIVGFGSITGIRGRGRNLAYGAAKRALRTYFESLRLLGSEAGVAVQFYVLGFLDTAKRAQEATPLPKGNIPQLAEKVVDGLGQGSFTRWYPVWWRPLSALIGLMPQALYRRIADVHSG